MTTEPTADLRVQRESATARMGVLLERARNGDSTAWEPLVTALNPRLWHLARAQHLTADEAMDAVQMAWLELLRHLDRLRDPQAVTAWLITTTKREAWRIASGRQRPVADQASAEQVGDPSPGPDVLTELGERDRVLWAAVDSLPLRCRQLLRMVAIQPRPDYTTIVEALGMPKGSIGPTRGRCLALLRRRLSADPRWSP